jgi:hypothetical protein
LLCVNKHIQNVEVIRSRKSKKDRQYKVQKKNDKRTSNDLQTLNRKAKIEQHEASINLTSYLMMQKNQLKYMSSNVFENELCTRAFKGTGSTNPSGDTTVIPGYL